MCSIDIKDFNETLPICSPKWYVKTPKISHSKTVSLLRYWNYNRRPIAWKMRVITSLRMHCIFHHFSTIMFTVMQFCEYILPYIPYILPHSKSFFVVLSDIAEYHRSYSRRKNDTGLEQWQFCFSKRKTYNTFDFQRKDLNEWVRNAWDESVSKRSSSLISIHLHR